MPNTIPNGNSNGPSPDGESRPIRVIVVEDELAHAKLLMRACRNSDPPVTVSIADSLFEARRQIEREVPDILVCDLVLPDGRGTALIPEDPHAAPYPVIVVTAQGSEKDAVEAIKKGAFDYVVKTDQVLADMPHVLNRTLREWYSRQHARRLEAELRKALHTARDLLDSLHLPIALIDGDGRVEMSNEAWNREASPTCLFGRACPVGASFPEFLETRGRLEFAAEMRQLLGGKRVHKTLSWECDLPENGAVCFELQIRPFREDLGHWILMHVDVTHTRRIEAEARMRAEALEKLGRLSPREMEVMHLMVQGLANREMAVRLSRAVKTVEMHRANLIKKLGANGSSDVVRLALIAYPELRNGN